MKLVNIPVSIPDNHTGSYGSYFKEIFRNQVGNTDTSMGGWMTGQVPFMNSYSPVHSHEIGHLGRFKPLAGAGGIPSYIPIPQFSVRVNKRTVIGMMVFLLGSNEGVMPELLPELMGAYAMRCVPR